MDGPDLDPRRVLIFRAVVRAGSISAAARTLGWTQPAVSQHLNRLEREARTPLLLRGSRGVAPTEAGRALLARADRVAAELHMAGQELGGLADLSTGRVRLVSFPSAAATIVPAALQRLRADHPGVEVTLTEAEPPEAWFAVSTGEADLALVFGYDGPPPDDGDLVWSPVAVEPVDLVVPADHAAATARRFGLRSLRDETWVGGCPRCRQHLIRCCRDAGFEPRLAVESDDYVVVQNLVASGLGVATLPRSALTAFRHPGVAVRPARALGTRHIGAVHRPGAEQVPATRALLDRLVRVARAADAARTRSPAVAPVGR